MKNGKDKNRFRKKERIITKVKKYNCLMESKV